jgi:hypothetical protein
VLRKCFELSSLVPLTVYVLIHTGSYLGALFGATGFGVSAGNGLELALEVALVWVPLAFHVGYGIWLSQTSLEQPSAERTRSLLLRASGFAALAFIAYHAFCFRLPILRGERDGTDVANQLALSLSTTEWGIPIPAIVHLLGLAVVSVHLAAGLARFIETWRLASAARAELVARLLSIALFAASSASVIELATGSALPNFVR